MMYVQQSLGPDEELVHIGQFHWTYTLQAFLMIFWGLVGSILVMAVVLYYYGTFNQTFGAEFFPPMPRKAGLLEQVRHIHPGIRIFAFLVFIYGLLRFAQMMVEKATTEIAITSDRLIYKRGLVARHVGEMSIDRIEGVDVRQSFWGRIFDYGRVIVRGMGVGEVMLPPMCSPVTFRRAIEKARSI